MQDVTGVLMVPDRSHDNIMSLPISHYYGDNVRKLFVAGAIIMTAMLPFFSARVSEPVTLSIIGILVLGVAAGLTSPKQPLTAMLDMLIALAAVVIFERYAVRLYGEGEGTSLFFLINQTLSIIFLIALYFATKTLRGMGNKKTA
jgi:hypothetical protein